MNKATEVMMQYVENLKRTYEKDHAELTEFKKLANQNSNRCYGGSADPGGETNDHIQMESETTGNETQPTWHMTSLSSFHVYSLLSRQVFDEACTVLTLSVRSVIAIPS